MNRIRVAFLEVSHWHFQHYLPGLPKTNIEVIGVSDVNATHRNFAADQLNCQPYSDYRDLLDHNTIDFAFAFGSHKMMPKIANDLIDRDIPFSIEKPGGTTYEDVKEIRRRAEEAKLFVGVALVYRVSNLLHCIRQFETNLPCELSHLSFRQIVGSPERYVANGNPWMLDPTQAGGGCLRNLGPHFIDLALIIGGGTPERIFCHTGNRLYSGEVEDYASVSLNLSTGARANIEVGYTFSMTEAEKREMTLTYASRSGYMRSTDTGVVTYDRSGKSIDHGMNLDTDNYFAVYRDQIIEEWRNDQPPLADLADLERVMQVIDVAYDSDRTCRVARLP